MIDVVIIISQNGGYVIGTSKQGEDFIMDSEFTSDINDTWCDKSVSIDMAVMAAIDGLKVRAFEDSPDDITRAIAEVLEENTEYSICNYLENLLKEYLIFNPAILKE